MLGRDACTVVAERKQPAVGLLLCRECDGGVRAGVVDGVVGEVAEDSVEQLPVSLHADVLGEAVFEGHPSGGERVFRLQHDVGHHRRDVHPLALQNVRGVVHLIERGNVLQQGREAARLGICALYEFGFRVVVDVGRFENSLGVAENAGYGCFQFVGNILRQFAAHLVLPLLLFTADALVHASGVAVQEPSQPNHHHEREHEQMPVADFAERVEIFPVVVFKNDENSGIDDENHHHAHPHFPSFAYFFHCCFFVESSQEYRIWRGVRERLSPQSNSQSLAAPRCRPNTAQFSSANGRCLRPPCGR